ncbi:MAG: alkaline phosphatase [Blastochloris sp.]|nr:alkaline phosphatase [Blastochloris sp.]
MNWRLRLISVLVILAFGLLAFSYYRYYVAPKPHGVIVFIVPGLNPELLGHYKVARGNQPLYISSRASDFTVVDHTSLIDCGIDPASIMTYFATGVTGLAQQLGYDPAGNRLDNLLYKAQRSGRLVGVISTESVIAPQVAAFYAHTKNVQDTEDLARQLFDSTTLSSIMGGGADDLFQSPSEKSRDLLNEAQLLNYKLITNQTPTRKSRPLDLAHPLENHENPRPLLTRFHARLLPGKSDCRRKIQHPQPHRPDP